MKHFDLKVIGGECFISGRLVKTDIGIKSGKIVEIGSLGAADSEKEIHAQGLTVFPGFIDSQVHFREPGLEHKEDLSTGSAAAVIGGVTSYFEMPNTQPSTTTEELFNDKIKRARQKSWANFAFYVGASAENADKLHELERLPGCSGVKMFMGSSTGSLLVDNEKDFFKVVAGGRRRLIVHSEDQKRLEERKHLTASGDVKMHPIWRDEETALISTKKLVTLARQVGRPVHVLHVSTFQEAEYLSQAKDIATCEVTPNHILLAAPDCYEKLGTFVQMNPPVRNEEHRSKLLQALKSGVFDTVGSDHAPHTREEKQKTYPQSPSGMPGVQTIAIHLLNLVSKGELTLQRVVEVLSYNPAHIFGKTNKGVLAVGYDADLSIFDLKLEKTVTNDWIRSRCGWTPYDGWRVKGWPIHTVVMGRLSASEGELVGNPTGQPVSFEI